MVEADLRRAGGVVGLVAGALQTLVALALAVAKQVTGSISNVSRVAGDIGSLFGMRDVGHPIEGPGFVWGLIFAYATVILSALLISGVRRRSCGVALIACGILGAFGGSGFALLAVLTIAGGSLALIGAFGVGGMAGGAQDGLRGKLQGVMATAQRMAKAATEADSDAPMQDAPKKQQQEKDE